MFQLCLYVAAVLLVSEQLEKEQTLPGWPEHADGSRWVWWAEESADTEALETEVPRANM